MFCKRGEEEEKIISLCLLHSLPSFSCSFCLHPFSLSSLLADLYLLSSPASLMMGAVNECCSSGSKSLIKEFFYSSVLLHTFLVCSSTNATSVDQDRVRHANGVRDEWKTVTYLLENYIIRRCSCSSCSGRKILEIKCKLVVCLLHAQFISLKPHCSHFVILSGTH